MQTVILGVLFIIATVVLVLVIYAVSRLLLLRFVDEDSVALAGSVIFRVSALHGLILALVFAQELNQYSELRLTLTEEASRVADIWNDVTRFGGEAVDPVQAALSEYAREVIGAEWTLLGNGEGLSPAAWASWDTVYETVIALSADTPRQETLRAHMIEDAQAIARLRDQREAEALYQLSVIFWVAAMAGVVLVAIPYFTFAPTVLNLSLLSIFGAYTGLIMHLIYAFSDPYELPARLPPAPFERLALEGIGG